MKIQKKILLVLFIIGIFNTLQCNDLPHVGFYLISGPDEIRHSFMQRQLQKFLPEIKNRVKWITYPNYNELTQQHMKMFIRKYPQPKGTQACCLKHYSIIKEIVENETPIAIIMEDNICFRQKNFIRVIEKYLEQLPNDFDALFEGDICNLHYIERPTIPKQLVYKKSNKITSQCHGSSRGCNFFIISLKGAKKLLENYLPITNAPDWHYNYLFRKLNMNIYWAKPALVHKIEWPNKTSQYN